MAVPKFNELFPAFLKCLNDNGIHHINQITDFCIKDFKLSDKDLSEKLTSGVSKIKHRVGWASTYLKKAGLIETASKGNFRLTESGKVAANETNYKVDLKYLNNFETFRNFISREKSGVETDNSPMSANETPIEAITNAIDGLNKALADELMIEIMKLTPSNFENLVIKLLIKMGYGSEELNKNAVTKTSGDEGIDGCIMADHFGFDSIYTQAKRWQSNEVVGRPEIQKFLGALVGQGATKGLYITTSKFSGEAYDFVAKHLQPKIILVDGKRLTNLMIKHNLGVSTVSTYEIKRVDSDFFNEEY